MCTILGKFKPFIKVSTINSIRAGGPIIPMSIHICSRFSYLLWIVVCIFCISWNMYSNVFLPFKSLFFLPFSLLLMMMKRSHWSSMRQKWQIVLGESQSRLQTSVQCFAVHWRTRCKRRTFGPKKNPKLASHKTSQTSTWMESWTWETERRESMQIGQISGRRLIDLVQKIVEKIWYKNVVRFPILWDR